MLYKYVVKRDRGFAPNPNGKYCTLSGCKTIIERKASIGDYILGLTNWNRGKGNKVVYFMRVDKKMTVKRYNKNSCLKKRGYSFGFVLMSKNFYYFGDKAFKLPYKWCNIGEYARGYRIENDEKRIQQIVSYFKKYEKGKHDSPRDIN